jgi:hypothetical protein
MELGTTEIEKFPSKSVTVPFLELASSKILTPGMGVLITSRTFPEIMFFC